MLFQQSMEKKNEFPIINLREIKIHFCLREIVKFDKKNIEKLRLHCSNQLNNFPRNTETGKFHKEKVLKWNCTNFLWFHISLIHSSTLMRFFYWYHGKWRKRSKTLIYTIYESRSLFLEVYTNLPIRTHSSQTLQ